MRRRKEVQALLLMLLKRRRKKRRSRRFWVRTLFLHREELGEYRLVQQMLQSDAESFYNYCRMSPDRFNCLLKRVAPIITHTGPRKPISPGERLAATLRYFATGNSQHSISENYRLSPPTLSRIISETSEAIYSVLHAEYLASPTLQQFEETKKSFWKKWNFPQCCGAIHGKLCVIHCPNRTGGTNISYKKSVNLIFLAVCDANYNFTLVDLRAPRQPSNGVFKNSPICSQLENGLLPPADILPNTIESSEKVPSVILGDETFPLRNYLMRPYPNRCLDDEKKIYNYRLFRAWRVIENTFGILSSRWRIFRRPISLELETAISVVKSTIVLHNFLMQTDETNPPSLRYCSASTVGVELSDGIFQEGSWRNVIANDTNLLQLTDMSGVTKTSCVVRERFKDFFVSDAGSVPWQEEYIRRTH